MPDLEIAWFSFTVYELALLSLVAVLVGMAKTGIQGVGMIAIPVLAIVFGGKASTGLILPILIVADLFAVYYYRQHANWVYLKKLVPFTLIGIALGTAIGNTVNDSVFTGVMAVIIFLSLGLMVWRERKADIKIPTSIWFAGTIGVAGGFATMVGNLAAPVMALYLLSMQLPKNQFIGTAAWFFLVVNLLKVPLHVFIWETITWSTILIDLALVPGVALGALMGVWLVKRIPEIGYRWFVIVMTAASALAMLLQL